MCLTCVKQVTVKQLYLLKKMTDIKENKNAITSKSPCDSMIINSGCQGLVQLKDLQIESYLTIHQLTKHNEAFYKQLVLCRVIDV